MIDVELLDVSDFEDDKIGKIIVDSAFYVHTTFGPGLLESVYEACLVKELKFRGIDLEIQKNIPLYFRGEEIEQGFRIDIFVAESIVVEVKAVEKILPVHEAQLLTYMKLTQTRLGYLINFNSPLIKDGIKRMVRRK